MVGVSAFRRFGVSEFQSFGVSGFSVMRSGVSRRATRREHGRKMKGKRSTRAAAIGLANSFIVVRNKSSRGKERGSYF